MLTDPNPDDPLVPEIAHVSYRNLGPAKLDTRSETDDRFRHTRPTGRGMRRPRGNGRGSEFFPFPTTTSDPFSCHISRLDYIDGGD